MENENYPVRSISIIGGTGNEGKGLAYRWAKAGYKVIIGSRQFAKAQTAADFVVEFSKNTITVEGMLNRDAAKKGDVVVITVPYKAHQATLEAIKSELSGKILIDVTVPLVPPKVSKVQMPPAGSALQEAKSIVGEDVRVAAAFQNISHEHLLSNDEIECDVLVCGEGPDVRNIVLGLVEDAGLLGWDAGPIENAVVIEGLTSVLIGINKKYKVNSSGIKITGIVR
ncbi:MAG: NADPH-dependent F420 reductase [Anaerolineaceae bacterium]|nr:NADPH-dependent F420 reductase [Anaerolineaceae bacterium]